MTTEQVSTFEGAGKGPKVAVLGGGVAGMSAAHELIERGFQRRRFRAPDRIVRWQGEEHSGSGRRRQLDLRRCGGPRRLPAG